MKKMIKYMTCIIAGLFTAFVVAYEMTSEPAFLTLAITFGTAFYHFTMRLLVGAAYNILMNNKADYAGKWFQVKDWEQEIYRVLRVKKWKKIVPTYDADLFNPSKKNWDEIAQAMCQSELVHETIALLSLVPILFSLCFGAVGVFVITSVMAASFDLALVVVQRYNRPRVIRMIKR